MAKVPLLSTKYLLPKSADEKFDAFKYILAIYCVLAPLPLLFLMLI